MSDDPSHDDRNYEDVRSFFLSPEREQEMLDAQIECVFMWTTREGEPVGVVMNFVHHDGRFWLTSASQRKRVAAIRRDPRVALAVTSRGSDVAPGRAVTYKGVATIHESAEVKAWFYPALAARVRPGQPDKQAAFAKFLDSPNRVVLEVVPATRIGFDSAAMWEATPEAAPDSHTTLHSPPASG